MSFFALNIVMSFYYFNNFLGVDDEDWRYELLQEGMMSSFGLFIVCTPKKLKEREENLRRERERERNVWLHLCS